MMASTSRSPSTSDEPDQKKMKTTTPTKNAMQKIYMIEDVEVRSNNEGKAYGVTAVLAKSTFYQQLHDLYVPAKLTGKFAASKNKFLLLNRFSQKEEGYIRISESSMVLDTQDTPIPRETLEKFTNPPVFDIAVIKTKQKGDRVSLRGVIEKTSNVLETPTSRRKIITVKDSSGSIELKLWGDKTQIPCEVEQTILLKCVTLDFFNTRASLNSNMSTTLEILNDQEQIEGTVEAACFEQDDMSIFVNDQLLKIDLEQMTTIFPNMEFSPNVKITATTQGTMILDVTSAQQEDKELSI